MSGKKIAIIYKSLTGNTRQVAEAIRDALGGEEIVYFGEPKPDIVADLYFVGSWTDKGSCDGTVGEYLKQLETLPPKLREAWLYGSWWFQRILSEAGVPGNGVRSGYQ